MRPPWPVTWFRAIHRMNLIYHCYARRDDSTEWQSNLLELKQRWHVFTGRRIISVVQGEDLETVDRVRDVLGEDAEWLDPQNDAELRETITFPIMLQMVSSLDPLEATFYAHTKGTDRRHGEESLAAKRMWRSRMYAALLDEIHVVRDTLLRHAFVGCCKIQMPPGGVIYPSGLRHGTWLYGGAFFWFRHDCVFARNWDVPRDRYGAEAWPAGVACAEEAATIMQPWPADQWPPPIPYRLSTWPAICRWLGDG